MISGNLFSSLPKKRPNLEISFQEVTYLHKLCIDKSELGVEILKSRCNINYFNEKDVLSTKKHHNSQISTGVEFIRLTKKGEIKAETVLWTPVKYCEQSKNIYGTDNLLHDSKLHRMTKYLNIYPRLLHR